MKRILILILAIVVMVLAAVRINRPKHQHANMVFVEDRIFVSSQQALPVEIAPEAILGSIEEVIEPHLTPDQNGQANFDCLGADYAKITNGLGGKSGLAVLVEHEWVFFEPKEP
ncbi:MAG: hypothetical protein IKU72_01610 [Oscillospiraceae bacterium]|nr:hypothetical protein [Oscillospiraceae bacterium]